MTRMLRSWRRLVDQDSPISHTGLSHRHRVKSINTRLSRLFRKCQWHVDELLQSGRLGPSDGFHAECKKQTGKRTKLDYKPDGEVAGAVHDAAWSYQYDITYPLNQRATVLSGEYRNVTDSWEMKAFVARSRTKAAGALDYVGGHIGAKISLRDDYGFGRERSDHSGQFRVIFKSWTPLYQKMRDTLEK